jgi:hypothetical protein
VSELTERIAAVAAELGKSTRTIWRWHKAGCDLSNPASIKQHSEHLGASARGKARIEAVAAQIPLAASDELDLEKLPAITGQGAAAALKRLQDFETRFASRLLAALDTNRADAIQVARDDYNKVANALRQYEREVEVTQRDLGHLIPKKESQDGARASAIWFRLAWRMWLSSTLPSLLAQTDPREALTLCERSFADVLGVALQNSQGAALSIPPWAMEVIREEWHLS